MDYGQFLLELRKLHEQGWQAVVNGLAHIHLTPPDSIKGALHEYKPISAVVKNRTSKDIRDWHTAATEIHLDRSIAHDIEKASMSSRMNPQRREIRQHILEIWDIEE